jgi:hypothetical protein
MAVPALTVPEMDLSPGELSQRVAVIKRFRELLKAQRDRFNAYLNALDKQKNVIEKGTTDDLLRHVELEEKIVEDIFSIQKVLEPLDKMYHSVSTEVPAKARQGTVQNSANENEDVSVLKKSLESLRAEAVIRAERNRELLAKRMTELRSEIKGLSKNAYSKRQSGNTAPPSYIDIKG